MSHSSQTSQFVCKYRRLEDAYSCFTKLDQLEILIHGYVREIQNILSKSHQRSIIPTALNNICITYILEQKSYFTIYDEIHSNLQTIHGSDENEQTISRINILPQSLDNNDNKCYICNGVGELLCCDTCSHSAHLICVGLLSIPDKQWFCGDCMVTKMKPFQQYQLLEGKENGDITTDIVFISELPINAGVHQLIFQCIKSHPNDKIGIISEGDLNKLTTNRLGHIYLYNDAFGKRRYFWWRHTKKVRTHNKRIRLEGIGKWNIGSYIKMIVDCDNWKLQFYHNQCSSQLIHIHPDIQYYAVLGMGDGNAIYRYKLE